MRRTQARALTALGAALAMVVVGALPSTARTQVTREDSSYGGFYFDNVILGTGEPDIILFAGAGPADMCDETPVPIVMLKRVVGVPPAAGARETESFVQRGLLELYDGVGMSAPEFVENYCGTPVSDRPEPVGVGEGLIQAEIVTEWFGEATPPAISQTDSARGSVRTQDGRRLVVLGEADVSVSPEFALNHLSVEILNRR